MSDTYEVDLSGVTKKMIQYMIPSVNSTYQSEWKTFHGT
jgi:hypothetical protein